MRSTKVKPRVKAFKKSESDLVDFLLERNREQSDAFIAPDAVLWRQQYRAKHPTEIAAWKCMDGRLNMAVMTETPPGIIQPFRNIGGKFDLGWPYFGALVREWVEEAVSRTHDCLILVTYHFSRGDTHRGCKGFGYDITKAQSAATILRKQVETVFGTGHSVVYPIEVGLETDEDAMVLHGVNGKTLDLSKEIGVNEEMLYAKIKALYPDMKEQMVRDLLALLVGNIHHIAEVRKTKRTIEDIDHKEQILGIGRGFDWLHIPNKALIVGPYSYDVKDPIEKAAGILLDNLRRKCIPSKDGIVLVASAVYRDQIGIEKRLATEKAISQARLALETIEERVPDLLPHLDVLVGILNYHTRFLTPIPFAYKRLRK